MHHRLWKQVSFASDIERSYQIANTDKGTVYILNVGIIVDFRQYCDK
jgi:hypothetical protein